jgi:hypothetical protein
MNQMMKLMGICMVLALALLACSTVQGLPAPEPSKPQDSLALGGLQTGNAEHSTLYLAQSGSGAALSELATSPGVDVAGNWTFELTDSRNRPVADLTLRLYQRGITVFGTGSVKIGLESQPSTAYGSIIDGSTMILGAISLQSSDLYKLSINSIHQGRIGGSFTAVSSKGEEVVSGSVSGGRDEPRDFSAFTS